MKIIKQQVPMRHPLYKWVFGLANDKRVLYRFTGKVIHKHKRTWRVPMGRDSAWSFNLDYKSLKQAVLGMYRDEEIKPCMYWK